MGVEISLKGKNAVVTGGAGGMGRTTSMLLAEAGANVLVSGSKIFGGDIAENVHQFKAIMAEYTK